MVTQQEKKMLWEYFGRSKEVNTQTTEIEFTLSCDNLNLKIQIPVSVEFYVHEYGPEFGNQTPEIEVVNVSLIHPDLHKDFEPAVRAMEAIAIEKELWDHLGAQLLRDAA